ncbi:protein phosphatase regulator [Fusarium falciforme]
MFPSSAQEKLYVHPGIHPNENLEPPSGIRTGNSYTVSHADQSYSEEASDDISTPGIPEHGEQAEDDTAVSSRPSHQVDYLSHDWREEDIWSSWRYIVTRRGEFSNSARLENASWRTWMKVKNNLRTISPESLNWLKVCDVTWLYGPLQSGRKAFHSTQIEPSGVSLSKTDSYVGLNKKPILKKRSLSEVMLQRPLSTASLLKQATAAPKAHETMVMLRPHLGRSTLNYLSYSLSQRRLYGERSNVVLSTESSGITTPNSKRKNIHFNEHVKQCIAVEVKGDDDEGDDTNTDRYGDDSDSNDGVMMKRIKTKKLPLSRQKTLKSKPAEGKTIAMLPSTTLKYWEDIPEPRETAMKHSRSSIISFSSSHEILRPTAQSSKLVFGEKDKDSLDDALVSPGSGWSSPPAEGVNGGLHQSISWVGLCQEPGSMRRTPSGMFIPYEGGEASSTDGILSRVIDTVNTARDIAHVIWNVGWTK